ncbi:MAG: hypothetical protein V3R96_02405, partial [Dehalococcoidales bacterium]
AQADEEEATSRPARRGSLAILAPRAAPVNQEISMTVFLRWDQTPFEGAGVWAFTRDRAEALREEIALLREDAGVSGEEEDYEAVAERHGTFLGRTDEDGKLFHTFEITGAYVLAAFRSGYFPGFTPIHIGERPDALAIRAPQRAPVAEEVTMAVYQKGTEEMVEGAGVWAVSRENVEILREGLTALREDTSVSAEEKDYQSVVSLHGIFLGRTDENGQISNIFEEEGSYLLVAIQTGYLPGFAPIYIGTPPQHVQGLTIWAPLRALVDTEVGMTVYQRGTLETIDGAGIWAITHSQLETLREELTALREDSDLTSDEKDYEALVDTRGSFLGRTDENGQLSHIFEEESNYILVAVKRGYFPGFSPIRIVSLPLTTASRQNGNSERNVKADALRQRGVPGNGISNAPGLQKARNPKQRTAKISTRAKGLDRAPGLQKVRNIKQRAGKIDIRGIGLDKAPGLKRPVRTRPAVNINPQNTQ